MRSNQELPSLAYLSIEGGKQGNPTFLNLGDKNKHGPENVRKFEKILFFLVDRNQIMDNKR
jgi:hypothetical protein